MLRTVLEDRVVAGRSASSGTWCDCARIAPCWRRLPVDIGGDNTFGANVAALLADRPDSTFAVRSRGPLDRRRALRRLARAFPTVNPIQRRRRAPYREGISTKGRDHVEPHHSSRASDPPR